jgi:hypothetical protein
MVRLGRPAIMGFGTFSIFAILGGLALLMGADPAALGSTGPEVVRCDYIEIAKTALADAPRPLRKFDPGLGYELVDVGSSVRVQQYLPEGSLALFEGPAVVIDRKSCRPCNVEVRTSTDGDPAARFTRFPPSGV